MTDFSKTLPLLHELLAKEDTDILSAKDTERVEQLIALLQKQAETAEAQGKNDLAMFFYQKVADWREIALGAFVFGRQAQTPGLTDAEKLVLAKGQKIQAIKMVRTRTGLGLRESKELVDAEEILRSSQTSTSEKIIPDITASDPVLSPEEEAMLDENNVIQAIKSLRSRTFVSLDTAKRIVDAYTKL